METVKPSRYSQLYRGHLLIVLCGALATGAISCGPRAASPPSDTAQTDQMVRALADTVVADVFEQRPELPTMLRPPGARYDSLPDDSLNGIAARDAQRAQWLQRLHSIDVGQVRSPEARLAYQLARARLADGQALQICHYELWTVSQMLNGWQVRFANLAQIQPVGTEELRAQALRRFGALPDYIDTQTTNLREGLRRGYRAADINVRAVIDQLDQLVATPPDRSPFFDPAQRDGDPTFRSQFAELVGTCLQPAIRRHRDFLRTEYLPQARSVVGVSSNPDGAACYRASLRYATTLDIEPEAIQALGVSQLASVEAEMRAISTQSFGSAPVPELLRRFKDDAVYRYRDGAQMIALAQSSMDRAWAALPTVFGMLPTAPAVVEPIPAFQERTAAPHYLAAALDGSRPAAYRIRLYHPQEQSMVAGEATAFHEVVPGHHLQINIANNRAALPTIARFLSNSGFSEGWGLYAERLAEEMGLYSNAADRFGMLSTFSWRAVRMIVDTGIHAKGWTRQQAIDKLLAHTALSPDQAAAEIDRYIAWPGQAPSYMLGYLEIRRLRDEAQRALGKTFDLRAFHDRVLEDGSVTLPMLQERIAAWLEKAE